MRRHGTRRLFRKALRHAATDCEMLDDTIKDLLDDDVILIAVRHVDYILH